MMIALSPYQAGRSGSSGSEIVRDKHFENVYNRYYRQIYGICRRYSSGMDEASDLTHDVFLRYFQNIDRFRHESTPSTWMYRVAVNLGIYRWKKDRSRFLEDQDLDSLPSATCESETALLDRITLTKIMGSFSENTQKVVLLHHVEKMTQVDIGKSLGISRATVIRHLIHFRESSRTYMARPTRARISVRRQGQGVGGCAH
jgi:RNA polymerase sigma-70 factor (ECF subfamily)